MPQDESLYHKFPDHSVVLEPNSNRVRVRFNGEVVADSTRSLTVRETKHAPVLYLPKDDLEARFFEPTDHETFCPFKGRASYWNLCVGDRTEANVVWGYPDPFDEVAALSEYVAFYADRVEWQHGDS